MPTCGSIARVTFGEGEPPPPPLPLPPPPPPPPGAISSFVIVQTLFWPAVIVTEPEALQSPLNEDAYPGWLVSETVYVPGANVLTTPLITAVVSTSSGKSAITLVPPLSFITTLFTLMVAGTGGGAISSFVIVQTLFWPAVIVTEPEELQSPLNEDAYPGWLVSETVYVPGANVLTAPLITAVVSTRSGKSAIALVPPLSLTTTLFTLMVAGVGGTTGGTTGGTAGGVPTPAAIR